ncbi:hypothetical protein ACFX13_011829 [Malus domestica]
MGSPNRDLDSHRIHYIRIFQITHILLPLSSTAITITAANKPKCATANSVEVSVQHENYMKDARAFVVLSATVDLRMDACRIFS